MKILATVLCVCLAVVLAEAAAPFGHLHYGAPLAHAHYAALPVAKAVSYGTAINHGTVLRYGLAPYGYRYAHPAVVKYGVPAPLAHVAPYAYGVHAAPYAYALGVH